MSSMRLTRNNSWLRVLLVAAALAAGLSLAACEPQQPEERLQEAAADVDEAEQQLEGARGDVASAKASVADLKQEVSEAEARLAQARKALRQRQKELAAERDELHDIADDTAVFRLLQTRLLNDSRLADAAVSVDVLDGRVTLRGEVPNPQQKAIAGEIAETTPGVSEVENLIDAGQGSDNQDSA